MKKRKKRALALMACAAVAAGITGIAFWMFGQTAPHSQTLSVGMQHLADEAYVAISAPAGESICFSNEWFDKSLGGAKVSAITVTALPDVTKGTLKLGYGEVSVGQVIQRENFPYLTFTPTNGAEKASFEFVPRTTAGDAGYALCCRLYFTEAQNCCPVGTGSVTAVSTHATLALQGALIAEDPEGDALHFEVVSYPQSGTLSLHAETGHFTYTPSGDFSGEDCFRWRVQDANGAFSEEAEVRITVRELTTGYLFSDIASSDTHTAALTLTERGLMSGEMLGGKHYFHPDRTLTRAGFVAILLEAADVNFPDAEDTGYTDDADIPRGMKGAIKYAREQGWLGEDTVFRPQDAITRAEAASIAAKVLGLSAPGYSDAVEDHASIPVSVVDALYAAYEGGYLSTMADGTLAPEGALTRGEAACFFARVLEEI